MFVFILFFLLPIFCYSSENIRESFDLSNFHGTPSAIVGGHVNVITGDFIDYEVDSVLPGPVPFVFDRVYSSSQILSGTLNIGWSINYNHSAMYYAKKETDVDRKVISAKNYFIVADGMGSRIKYRGLHTHDKISGGYRAEKKQFEKGLTNISEEGISGKSNIANNEAWIDPKRANLRTGNGDVLHFKALPYRELTVFGSTVKLDFQTLYIPKKKVKLNRTTESYSFYEDVTLSSVSFLGSEGKELGHFSFHSYENMKYIDVESPDLNSPVHMKFKTIRNMCHPYQFLQEVQRPYAPTVCYDYERYQTQFDEKKAARLCYKSYPDQRYLRVKYYDLGHQTVQNKKIHIKEPDELRHTRVKKIEKPLGETEEPVKEYEFIYHVHEKNGYLYGSTDVFDAHDTKKTYHFDKSRLQSIDIFCNCSWVCYPYRTERFHWGNSKNGFSEGQYVGKTIEDPSGNVISGNFVKYDSFGNIIKEYTFGNLSGFAPNKFKVFGFNAPKSTENYVKEMAYTQDAKNLLIEEQDFRMKKILRYYEGTNLVSAEYLSDHQKICRRTFFFYDENGCKTKQIIDDGSQEDVNDLTNMSERLITEYKMRTSYPFGLAEEEIFKVYDRATGTEKQLKRLKKHHSIEGWVLQEDLFDEDDRYVFSKEYRYNKFGKIIYEKDPIGAVIERAYDANNNLIEEKGPLPGFQKLFTYDFCNRLIKEEEILHNEGEHLVKTYRYNKKSERIEETDFSGNVTKYIFDELGREIATETPTFFSETGMTTLKTFTEYDILDHPIVKTDSKGNKTKTLFTARGKPYFIQYPDGTIEKTYYDLDDTIKESIDKYGNVTRVISDYQSRPISKKVFAPSGELLKESSSEYSAFHLTQETDALGCKTIYEYDFAGRLIRKARGDSLEEYAYDALSRLSKIVAWTTASDAVVILKHYDNNNRVIEESTMTLSGALQARVRYEYNYLGKQTKEIRHIDENSEAVIQYKYNGRGDLIETISPLGFSTSITYDYCFNHLGERGIRVSSIDPKGVLTISDKNPLGLEKRVEKKNSLGETLQLWDNLYNSNGEKSKRIEVAYCAGKQLRHVITEWKWDLLGRLASVTEAFSSPDEKTTSISYNAYSQRDSITKPSGVKILYAYDGLGRMSRWRGSDDFFDYNYTYDAMDNPLCVKNTINGTATTKIYDIQSRLLKEEQANGYTVLYEYERGGRPSRFTYPDGSFIKYEYEGLQTRFIRRFTSDNHEYHHFEALEYDYNGKLKRGKLPLEAGGLTLSHDIMGRTTRIHSPFFEETVTGYDSAGNLLTRNIQDLSGQMEESFAYDELNQIIEENGAAAHKYRFDSLYNRVVEDEFETSINDLNQTLNRKDANYRYDVDGNLVALNKLGKTLLFSYDAAGRMTWMTDGKVYTSYEYDETNRRIAKSLNSEVTRYIYSGQCELGTYDQGGEIRVLSGLGLGAEIGDAIAIEKAGAVLVPFHDHNGNLMGLVDGKNGIPIYNARYSAFGVEVLKEGNPISWGFASKRMDLESGFIFFGRRYYDPESGRFITKDPLGDSDGPNLYAYVSNNPLMFVDLWGLTAEASGQSDCFSPISFGQRACSFVGQCLEMPAKHCMCDIQGRTAIMGIGRLFQGKSFFDNEENTVVWDKISGSNYAGAINISVTGIMSSREDGKMFAQNISTAMGGEEVNFFTSVSQGMANDLSKCAREVLGFQNTATRGLASQITESFNELRNAGYSKPQINLVCHSRGGLETYLALKLLPVEIQESINVYTIGSAQKISDRGLAGAVNYENPNDIVSRLAYVYCWGNGAQIVNTGYSSGGMFGMIDDHMLGSEGYQRTIDLIADVIIDKRGLLK